MRFSVFFTREQTTHFFLSQPAGPGPVSQHLQPHCFLSLGSLQMCLLPSDIPFPFLPFSLPQTPQLFRLFSGSQLGAILPSQGHLATSRDIATVIDEALGAVLLTSGEQRTRLLLKVVQCPGPPRPPPQARIIWPPMSIVPRSRNTGPTNQIHQSQLKHHLLRRGSHV